MLCLLEFPSQWLDHWDYPGAEPELADIAELSAFQLDTRGSFHTPIGCGRFGSTGRRGHAQQGLKSLRENSLLGMDVRAEARTYLTESGIGRLPTRAKALNRYTPAFSRV